MKRLLILLACLMLITGCTKKPVEEPAIEEEVIETQEIVEPVLGGWEKPESGEITEELQEIFNKATEKLLGVKYEALELLETQVVAGMNYKFLANATTVVSNAEPRQVEMVIYKDLQGECTVTDITELNETLAGGWEENNQEVTEELLDIFNRGVEGTEFAEYVPTKLLATQVVSGINYKFLCENGEEIIVYRDLNDNCSVLEINN